MSKKLTLEGGTFEWYNKPTVKYGIFIAKPVRKGPIPVNEAEISGENFSDYDFTALDQVMPHLVYGRMYWVCVLNPGEETFETKVRQLLAEAYDLAVSKYKRQAARR